MKWKVTKVTKYYEYVVVEADNAGEAALKVYSGEGEVQAMVPEKPLVLYPLVGEVQRIAEMELPVAQESVTNG